MTMSNPDDLVETAFDDQALFNDANTDEPAPQADPEPSRSEPEPQPEPEPPAQTEVTAEKPPIPPKPEWRLKEDAEARRAAETELAQERADKAALKQRLEALERANQPKPEPPKEAERPDPLLDPAGYAKSVREEIRQELLNERREESLLRAREANQTEFDEAYAAAQKQVDPALKARMQASRDPGKTLLEWHRENKVRTEVGNDPQAYIQRKLDEALKDPAFLARALEASRAVAQPQTNGRPNVDLPPSLSSASRSNSSQTEDNDTSDEGLWRHANA